MVLMVEGVLIVIIAHENHGVGGISNVHGCCSFCVTLLGFIPALALEVCNAICFLFAENFERKNENMDKMQLQHGRYLS